jgi:hypothetical protein
MFVERLFSRLGTGTIFKAESLLDRPGFEPKKVKGQGLWGNFLKPLKIVRVLPLEFTRIIHEFFSMSRPLLFCGPQRTKS